MSLQDEARVEADECQRVLGGLEPNAASLLRKLAAEVDRLAADLDRTTDALKMIVYFPFDVMSDAPTDLRQVKEIAGAALASVPEEGAKP